MDFEEKTLKRESKFKGHIFEVAVDEVLLPDGKTAGRDLILSYPYSTRESSSDSLKPTFVGLGGEVS